ncbi:MAG: tetratricopeptide repeat protein [Terracidiphilus sp.]|jgi:tetratricopeptide (TPR) repeat protein
MSRNLYFSALLAVALVPLTSLYAQNTGAAAGGERDPGAMTGTGSGSHFDQTFNEQVGGMHFVGKVVVAGSKLPWDPIPVTIVCDGKVRDYVLADNKKGEFFIQPSNQNSEVVRSARDPKKVDPAQYVGCKVSAVLEGFESTTLTIRNGSIMDDPDIGTITLSQDPRATGSIVSRTLALAPSDALAELSKAQSDEQDKSYGSAKKHLQKATTIDPQLAEAWYHLGKLQEKDNKLQDALIAYNKAAAADPKYIPPYQHIASISATQAADPKFGSPDVIKKKWQDVVDATNHALELNPAGTPQIWYWNSVGNYNIGDKELAEKAALTSLSMDPSHKAAPKTEDQLAVVLASRGKYKDSLQHLYKCQTYTPPGPDADLIKAQIAQLEKIVPASAR